MYYINKFFSEVCNQGNIENEIHFVTECNAYIDQREALFKIAEESDNKFRSMTNEAKLIHMMQHHQISLLNYVYKAWLIRRNVLFR